MPVPRERLKTDQFSRNFPVLLKKSFKFPAKVGQGGRFSRKFRRKLGQGHVTANADVLAQEIAPLAS